MRFLPVVLWYIQFPPSGWMFICIPWAIEPCCKWLALHKRVTTYAGLTPWARPSNERRRYIVNVVSHWLVAHIDRSLLIRNISWHCVAMLEWRGSRLSGEWKLYTTVACSMIDYCRHIRNKMEWGPLSLRQLGIMFTSLNHHRFQFWS